MTVIDRSTIKTPEQAAAWLAAWDDEHFLTDGAMVLPHQPWKRATERDLRSVADALLKLRALFDVNGSQS
jgi:hypothetical protein